LSLCSVKGLNDINLFFTWFTSRESASRTLADYPPLIRNVTYIHPYVICCLIFIFTASRPDTF
jgi:hypothetical protein